jgi:hypothetical protein
VARDRPAGFLGIADLACWASPGGASLSPWRRGLRTPGRSLGRFPKTPRSAAGVSGLSGSALIRTYSTFRDGRVRHYEHCGTHAAGRVLAMRMAVGPASSRGCHVSANAPERGGAPLQVVVHARGFPQQMARNRGAGETQRISCGPSFECPMLGRTPATGAHHSHRQHSCHKIGLWGSQAGNTRLGKSGPTPDRRPRN